MTVKINSLIPIFITTFFGVYFFIPVTRAETISLAALISEVQIAGIHSDDEFIELYNPDPAKSFSLKGFRLCRKTSSGSLSQIKSFTSANDTIPPKGYYLFAHSNSSLVTDSHLADTVTGSSALASNNSIALTDTCEAGSPPSHILDSVGWGTGKPFDSHTFIFPTNIPASSSLMRDLVTKEWQVTTLPTPTNTRGETIQPTATVPIPAPDPAPPTESSSVSNVRLNEIFPNPSEKGEGNEFIELYNGSEKTVSLIGWSVKKDRSESGKYTIKAQDFPEGTDISVGKLFLIPRQTSGFVMANSNKIISLYSPSGQEVHFVEYKSTKEGVSLNYTPTGWRGGTPTPGTVNTLNTLPKTKEKIPKKGYRGVSVAMSTKGKDADGDTLKYTWDFGDGHKSYKKETTHIYEKNGTYTVTLTIHDGKEDSIETFSIKIQSYESPEIRITSLVPNPSGKDTDNEWITLKNQEKKAVNLRGFSIATGSKKLVNHPIREDFILEPKQETKITHLQAAFTLPNQKGKIELRAPDGKPIQKIAYKLEKSAAEDAVYSKKKGERWKFEEIQSQSDDKPTPDTTDTEQPANELSTTENTELGQAVSEPTEENIPEASIIHTSGPVSEDPDRPQPVDILNYGTSLTLPDNVTFTPHDTTLPLSMLPEVSSRDEDSDLLTKINASLNDFLNR